MQLSNNQQAFLALVRAGLWEKDVQLASYGLIDFNEVYRLAEEQAVVGLVAAGIEHVEDVKVPQQVALQFAGQTLQIEQRNLAMNDFVGKIVERMRVAGINTLLVKGQGVAQCYERPLWRSCGDIDFLSSGENYQKAAQFLTPLSINTTEANPYTQHQAYSITNWEVEIHGTLRSGLWKRLDREIDKVQGDILYRGRVRSWVNGRTQIFLPGIDEDVVFVFTHILQHFFQEGIGLRQICDWCRLLWVHKDIIDQELLGKRLCSMGIMSEWKAFTSLAVYKLGMPTEGVPFYSSGKRWKRKARRILGFIMETGSFGHNRDYSYYKKNPYITFKIISFWRHTKDGVKYFCIFPADALKIWLLMITRGIAIVRNRK